VGRYDLGLSAEEFFELTPRQFDALLKRHLIDREYNELLFGQLTSWVANSGVRAPSKPFKPTDFMPSQWMKKASKPKRKRMTNKTRRELTAQIRAMFPVIKK
jgi:hypothetical protein